MAAAQGGCVHMCRLLMPWPGTALRSSALACSSRWQLMWELRLSAAGSVREALVAQTIGRHQEHRCKQVPTL